MGVLKVAGGRSTVTQASPDSEHFDRGSTTKATVVARVQASGCRHALTWNPDRRVLGAITVALAFSLNAGTGSMAASSTHLGGARGSYTTPPGAVPESTAASEVSQEHPTIEKSRKVEESLHLHLEKANEDERGGGDDVALQAEAFAEAASTTLAELDTQARKLRCTCHLVVAYRETRYTQAAGSHSLDLVFAASLAKCQLAMDAKNDGSWCTEAGLKLLTENHETRVAASKAISDEHGDDGKLLEATLRSIFSSTVKSTAR